MGGSLGDGVGGAVSEALRALEKPRVLRLGPEPAPARPPDPPQLGCARIPVIKHAHGSREYSTLGWDVEGRGGKIGCTRRKA